MGDQFNEWDRFYASYQKAEDPIKAFKKYRRGRKRRGKMPKLLSPAEKLRMEYEMRVEKRRIEALQLKASAAVAESLVRASKSTTRSSR